MFYFIHNYCDGRTSEVLKVTLPNNGRLVGRYLTSQNGTGFRAFMGVPYAEPPIGELRFKVNLMLKKMLMQRILTVPFQISETYLNRVHYLVEVVV